MEKQTMDEETSKEYALKFAYSRAIYSGIYNRIEFEMKYCMEDDRTEELQYLVDRYCREEIISGQSLRDKLEEYKTKRDQQYALSKHTEL